MYNCNLNSLSIFLFLQWPLHFPRLKKEKKNRRQDIEMQNAEIRGVWRSIKVAKVFNKSSADS